jgi:hypothetical protein
VHDENARAGEGLTGHLALDRPGATALHPPLDQSRPPNTRQQENSASPS